MSAFKAGDRVTVEGVFRDEDSHLSRILLDGYGQIMVNTKYVAPATPPPAPNVEREAVPGRTGQVLRSADGSLRITVLGCYGYGSEGALYGVTAPNSNTASRVLMSEEDLSRDYPVVVKLPAPVPAPEAKREFQPGDVVTSRALPALGEHEVADVWTHRATAQTGVKDGAGKLVWWYTKSLTLVRPASPPEPAAMAAGERAYAAYWRASSIGSWNVAAFGELSKVSRDEWEAAAQAVLAARPATVAKGEWEVGWVLRSRVSGNYIGATGIASGAFYVLPFSSVANAKKARGDLVGGRERFVLVRVTRTRRVKP